MCSVSGVCVYFGFAFTDDDEAINWKEGAKSHEQIQLFGTHTQSIEINERFSRLELRLNDCINIFI